MTDNLKAWLESTTTKDRRGDLITELVRDLSSVEHAVAAMRERER